MLRRLQISEFGKFRDLEFDLAPVTIFWGPNESGKTTIFDALTYALCSTSRARTDLLKRRYGESLGALCLDDRGKHCKVQFDYAEFMSLFAVRSSVLRFDGKAAWAQEMQKSIMGSNASPDSILKNLEYRGNLDNKKYRHVAAYNAQVEKKKELQSRHASLSTQRAAILSDEREAERFESRLVELQQEREAVKQQQAKVKTQLESDEKARAYARARDLNERLRMWHKLQREVASLRRYEKNEFPVIDAVESKLSQLQGELEGKREILQRTEAQLLEKQNSFTSIGQRLDALAQYERNEVEILNTLENDLLEADRKRQELEIRLQENGKSLSEREAGLHEVTKRSQLFEAEIGKAEEDLSRVSEFLRAPPQQLRVEWRWSLLVGAAFAIIASMVLGLMVHPAWFALLALAAVLASLARTQKHEPDLEARSRLVTSLSRRWKELAQANGQGLESLEDAQLFFRWMQQQADEARKRRRDLTPEVEKLRFEIDQRRAEFDGASSRSNTLRQQRELWLQERRTLDKSDYLNKVEARKSDVLLARDLEAQLRRARQEKLEAESSLKSLDLSYDEMRQRRRRWLEDNGVENVAEYNARVADFQTKMETLRKLEEDLEKEGGTPLSLDVEVARQIESFERSAVGIEPLNDMQVRVLRGELETLALKAEELQREEQKLVESRTEIRTRQRVGLGSIPADLLRIEKEIADLNLEILTVHRTTGAARFAAQIFKKLTEDAHLQFLQVALEVEKTYGSVLGVLPNDTPVRVQVRSLAENDLSAADAGNQLRGIENLSTGTRDAFLLAMRIVLAQKQREKSALEFPLLVLDEPFAALDSQRMAHAVSALAAMARVASWQLIFFTKEESVCGALTSVFADAKVHQLRRGT